MVHTLEALAEEAALEDAVCASNSHFSFQRLYYPLLLLAAELLPLVTVASFESKCTKARKSCEALTHAGELLLYTKPNANGCMSV